MSDDVVPATGPAFGWPGIPPRWTGSAKEGVGTAYSTASRVWFTVSHGIVNEVYYPTIDRPQTRDMELLITDGETFFHEEKRDLRNSIELLHPDPLGYRVTGEDPGGRYRVVKEVISNPHLPCVLLRVWLEPAAEWADRLRVHVLLAPHLDGGGAGNSARRHQAAGREILVAWKDRLHLALGADVGFTRTSCGFVGASDGWRDLRDNFRMDWEFDSAENGNVAVMGEVDLSRGRAFTLGLGFGYSLHAAVTALSQSLAVPYESHRERFIAQWQRVCCEIEPLDGSASDGGRLYRLSHKLLLAHEDKTFAGALIASASIPWGEAKGDEDLGGYHLVWTRDMVQSATGLLACGSYETPRQALVYLACSQRPDGGFPQNFWLDGTPHFSKVQLDEVAFPILLAWRLWQVGGLEGFDPYPMVRAAAAFLVRQGPITEQERWEEASGYSPSTLAVTIAALVCAAAFARDRGESAAATFLEESADFMEAHLERWTVTTAGALLPGVPRHYIRISPTDIADPVPLEDPNAGVLEVLNLPPGALQFFPARDIVDAGFLELVRYGLRPPGDPLIEDSLRVVDAVLKVDTPFGPCWRRYNHDGYGQGPGGRPYTGHGQGRAWPLLTGERGHYELACGRDVRPYLRAMEGFAGQSGMLPEQVWDEPGDWGPATSLLGRATGSAMPLMWAHAEYVKLLRSTADGQVFDLIPAVVERYRSERCRRDLEVWKPCHHVRSAAPGQVLRVQVPGSFRLRWTRDEWASFEDTSSTPTGLGVDYVDLAVVPGQRAPFRFTFYWTEREAWEGRDYLVMVSRGEGA